MQLAVVLAILIPSIILSWIVSVVKRRRTVARQLKAEWGAARPPRAVDEDAMSAIAACYRDMPLPPAKTERVDDVTWNDLDMDAVFRYLNRAQSGAGEETMYAMLRGIDASDETLKKRKRWISALAAAEPNRTVLQKHLRALGHEHEHGAFPFLQNPEAAKPANAWAYFALAAVPFAFIALGFLNPLWLLGIGASLLVNSIVYYRTKQVWMRELSAIRHLSSVMYCARRLRRISLPGMEDGLNELRSLCAALRPLARWNGLLYMQRVHDFDFLTDYLRIAFQLDMISLARLSGFIKKQKNEVLRMYLLVGEIDACIAVASLRQSLKQYAVPEFRNEKRVLAEGVAHPLLRDPVPNTIDWDRNVLVTGSNASGKSTFVKAVAVNAVLAQSIVTCFAERFQMPRAQVFSSMALRDNVQGGESYFIVEVKSLRRILSALRDDRITLCFIDEILRGTNTVERIAASTSLLRYMSKQNALCIAATHDMELTSLLPRYRQVHFREEITPKGMAFPYRLFEGVSDTRNAIRLLEQMGFPPEIIAAADEMAGTHPAAEVHGQPAPEDRLSEQTE